MLRCFLSSFCSAVGTGVHSVGRRRSRSSPTNPTAHFSFATVPTSTIYWVWASDLRAQRIIRASNTTEVWPNCTSLKISLKCRFYGGLLSTDLFGLKKITKTIYVKWWLTDYVLFRNVENILFSVPTTLDLGLVWSAPKILLIFPGKFLENLGPKSLNLSEILPQYSKKFKNFNFNILTEMKISEKIEYVISQ